MTRQMTETAAEKREEAESRREERRLMYSSGTAPSTFSPTLSLHTRLNQASSPCLDMLSHARSSSLIRDLLCRRVI